MQAQVQRSRTHSLPSFHHPLALSVASSYRELAVLAVLAGLHVADPYFVSTCWVCSLAFAAGTHQLLRISPMQPGSKFSLAGALFDWPVGEGCANPTEHAPDSWRTAFESCADAEVWLGLFRSCSSSRDWAWRTAPSASVVLDCTVSGRTQAARQQHFQAVQQCLSVRGALPTKLTVACDQDLTRDSSALTAVSGVGAGIVSIHVRSKGLHSMPREGPAAVLLQGLALACPNTTSIALTHVMCQLPPPSKFPHVTELVIRPVPPKPLHPTHDTPTDWPSKIPTGIVAYAGQLTSLHLDAPDEYWTQFFSRPNPVPKLTHFSTSNMSKQLVGSLCEHARALRQVTSGSSSLGWAQGEWCVDTIVLVGAIGNDTFASMPARRDGGRLVVSAPALRLTVCAEQVRLAVFPCMPHICMLADK